MPNQNEDSILDFGSESINLDDLDDRLEELLYRLRSLSPSLLSLMETIRQEDGIQLISALIALKELVKLLGSATRS